MEDAEQSGILPASTHHSWMKPLSGLNGPLCHLVLQRSGPEATSKLSHEVRTVDTPWRRRRAAKARVQATDPWEGRGCWHCWKDKPEARKGFVVLGCSHLPYSGIHWPDLYKRFHYRAAVNSVFYILPLLSYISNRRSQIVPVVTPM